MQYAIVARAVGLRAARNDAWRGVVALALLAAYALPLFAPPAATLLLPYGPAASLLERLFPGVPPWWIVGRLCCLALGAWLATSAAAPTADVFQLHVDPPCPPRRWQLWLAALLAAAQVLAGMWADQLDRMGQLLFLLLIPLPALVTLTAWRNRPPASARSNAIAVLSLPLLWVVTWLPFAWRSPWVANLVDTLGTFGVLQRTATDPQLNLLTGEFVRGGTGLFLVLQGAGLLDLIGKVPTFQTVQLSSGFWTLLGGVANAALALRLFGRHAAPVSAAALLYAPFCLVATMFLAPMCFGPVLPAILLLLLHTVYCKRSAAALIALAAISGMLATNPTLVLIGFATLACGLWSAHRQPRLPILAGIAAVLCFLGVALPGLPAPHKLAALFEAHSMAQAPWAVVEALYFGQVDPDLVRFSETATASPRFDVLTGSLLGLFATPRTAMRFWGDTLFEPITGALLAVGIATCLRARTPRATALLLFLVLALAPSFGSSYDRASLTRSAGLATPVVLLATLGFERLRATYLRKFSAMTVGAACAVTIAIGGWVLARVVQPKILARSATGIALDTLAGNHAGTAVIVHSQRLDPQATAVFASNLPRPSVATLPYLTAEQLQQPDGAPVAAQFFWSPGLEEQRSLARDLCARWPETRLFTLYDEAHLSRTFVASPRDGAWQPAAAAERWSISNCKTRLETEGSRARAVVAKGRRLFVQRRPREAITALRAAAAHSFVQVPLFDLLARALLMHPQYEVEEEEAIFWAERAVRASDYCLARPVTTLVRAYALRRRVDDALQTRARARYNYRNLCRYLPDGHPLRGR